MSLESQLEFLILCIFIKYSFDFFEDGEWITLLINAVDDDLFFLEGNFGPSIKLELWNRQFKFFHELCHHRLNSSMDDKLCSVVERRLLEVNDYVFATAHFHVDRDQIGRLNS